MKGIEIIISLEACNFQSTTQFQFKHYDHKLIFRYYSKDKYIYNCLETKKFSYCNSIKVVHLNVQGM